MNFYLFITVKKKGGGALVHVWEQRVRLQIRSVDIYQTW